MKTPAKPSRQKAATADGRAIDISGLKRKLPYRETDSRRYESEIRRYFDERLARLKIVKTTKTPLGQTIDWVPVEAQPGLRGEIAKPPGPSQRIVMPKGDRVDRLVSFELEDRKVERGPAGTVPILRKNLDGISFSRSLSHVLAKYRGPRQNLFTLTDGAPPSPSVDGPHWHGMSQQAIIAFGGDGVLAAFDPYCENSDDFSLMQIALSNGDTGRLQTVEAGWQQRKDSYGDWHPHLFTYYTTNGYTNDDDNVGGYNEDVDGWVQHDDSVHPGALSSPNSTRGGDQYAMQIKYQLFENNWWLMCNGRWLGYYPARLFMGNQSVFSTLGDHADHVSFYGEIYDSNDTPGKTKSDMGSGYWPEYGWTWAAYQRNLRVQTDRAGGMGDYNGTCWTTAPDMYGIEGHMLSGSDWGSYFYVGGPGIG